MPLVTLSLPGGLPSGEAQAISDAVHRCLVETVGIPDADYNHRILSLDAAHRHVPEGSSERYVCVEIRMYPGRSPEMKQALFRAIEARLGTMGIAARDVFVVIDEPPRENWSVSSRPSDRPERRG